MNIKLIPFNPPDFSESELDSRYRESHCYVCLQSVTLSMNFPRCFCIVDITKYNWQCNIPKIIRVVSLIAYYCAKHWTSHTKSLLMAFANVDRCSNDTRRNITVKHAVCYYSINIVVSILVYRPIIYENISLVNPVVLCNFNIIMIW